ncbi:SurA N-terminal domain-containing protein [Catenovulum sp. SM1970]|uniref:SurA N-terminal domain-containing protein n=1 Tax=Marinifaba aquimaris TaxID=2741323 RepID=UPI0015720397|nr:SurA N-terminal domain-containing protein [Marinifaba aquimaris]NTS77809.1 SurA N-terminal domain-containing protein [Marinifaba aquimaris]
MLERIREGSQGVAAKAILGLVIASFAFAGVGSYINMRGDIAAAEVNGEEVSQRDFVQALESERNRMESQYGQMFSQLAANPEYMRNFRDSVLEKLINQELTDQAAKNLSLRVSDEEIKEAIFAMPAFHIDGKFDNSLFLQTITRAGYQASTFRETLRADMTRSQLLQALTASEFSLPSESDAYQSLMSQTRDFTYATANVEQFKADVRVEASQLEAFYQQNIARYETQEEVALAYIELRVEDLMAGVDVTDAELESDYESNKAAYTSEERRRASHILIDFSSGEDEAKVKAEDLLAQIKAGADFAELAKAHSTDTFSGENGGDLDFFAKGVMAPEFEEAAFSLANKGDVSELVQTDFGFHIIKLTDVEAQAVKSFAEVKDEIADKIKREKANILFGEKQQVIADLVFEVSDSLDDAAAEVGIEVKTTELFNRNNAPIAVSNALVLNAAFSEEVAKDGYNSEVIELSADHMIVVRANDYKAARTQTLDEVKPQVEAAVTREQATKAAQEWAQGVLAKWSAGEDVTEALAEKGAVLKSVEAIGRDAGDMPSAVREQAFSLAKPVEGEVSATWLDVNQQVAIVRLDKVTDQAVVADGSITQRLQAAYADASYRAFIASLKDSAEIVKVNQAEAEQ